MLKKLIDDFVKQNETVVDFLENYSQDYLNADRIIPLLADTIRHTKFNPALGLELARLLQLSNDKEIFEQYQLEDISKLFTSLLRLQDSNLDTYIDAAHFEWAVMNNCDNAKDIIITGLDKAMKMADELKQLLDKIDSE